MLRNSIHLHLEKLENLQYTTFMSSLCEGMHIDYQLFCLQTAFGDVAIFLRILDLVLETSVVKDAKVNFDLQLKNLRKRFR